MSKPTVIILAAGSNSRFFPLNTGIHKSGLELLGEPLLFRTLRNLESHRYTKVILVVSSQDTSNQGLAQLIEGSFSSLDITFVKQAAPNGMGDAVLQTRSHIEGQFAVIDPVLLNAGEVLDDMLKLDTPNVLCSSPTTEPWLYGILTLKNGKAVSIVEKPARGQEPSNHKVQGVYLLSEQFLTVLEKIPPTHYNFEDALQKMMAQQPMAVHQLESDLPSLKYPWHLFTFQTQLLAELKSDTSPDAHIAKTAVIDTSQGPVVIESGATVGHAAKVIGPCYIGSDALVGDFSFVRGSSIESQAVVGANTEVVRSIVMQKATLHYSYLADSIVGPAVKIGAGLITANKRLDREVVKTLVKDEMVDTGRKALGIIVGDKANIGIRTSTMPGVLIGSQATIHPGLVLSRNIDHQAVVSPT